VSILFLIFVLKPAAAACPVYGTGLELKVKAKVKIRLNTKDPKDIHPDPP
jgi:hypothetical protein